MGSYKSTSIGKIQANSRVGLSKYRFLRKLCQSEPPRLRFFDPFICVVRRASKVLCEPRTSQVLTTTYRAIAPVRSGSAVGPCEGVTFAVMLEVRGHLVVLFCLLAYFLDDFHLASPTQSLARLFCYELAWA